MSLPPEPRANPDLAGHDAACAVLAAAARSGRLHHAWLLAGPPGIGKATLAFRFARWLLAGMPADVAGHPPLHVAATDPVFRRIASSAHADLMTLAPDVAAGKVKRQIPVEQARDVPRFLSLTPAEGGFRVVVLDEAEAMHPSAANALLKTIEEPSRNTVLLIVSGTASALLPTIRSRVRRLDLAPLGEAPMAGLLGRWLPDMPRADRERLALAAAGSPGQALLLAEGEGLALAQEADRVLAALANPDERGWFLLADRLAAVRDGSAFVLFWSLLRAAVASGLARAAAGERPAWVGQRSLAEVSEAWSRIGAQAKRTELLNLDRKQSTLTMLGWLAGR
ncbi:DNA polymerase III subunit delta' [Humitalea sp. 24SJ18S-53]|uniref:DNA polymerase III subunit delta' n=1 Tax=Humitalea sp. 24SJ18S-53 TaxID=3422307 RepID=UPI003D67154D